jgi:hypothetical protein
MMVMSPLGTKALVFMPFFMLVPALALVPFMSLKGLRGDKGGTGKSKRGKSERRSRAKKKFPHLIHPCSRLTALSSSNREFQPKVWSEDGALHLNAI